MERISDHCFVPDIEDQLKDVCVFANCGKREIDHYWTVEARESNPDPDPIKAKLIERIADSEQLCARLMREKEALREALIGFRELHIGLFAGPHETCSLCDKARSALAAGESK